MLQQKVHEVLESGQMGLAELVRESKALRSIQEALLQMAVIVQESMLTTTPKLLLKMT